MYGSDLHMGRKILWARLNYQNGMRSTGAIVEGVGWVRRLGYFSVRWRNALSGS